MLDRETLFRDFAAVAGISGAEQKTAELVMKLAEPFVDEMKIDAVGNVICHRKGTGKTFMLAAHMDAVGFYVKGFDEKGNVFVNFNGGLKKNCFWNKKVRFESGLYGITRENLSNGNDVGSKKPGAIQPSDIYIEIGAKSYEEAASLVKLGESVVWVDDTTRLGDRIMTPYSDDIVGCIIMLDMMERLYNSGKDVFYVFSVCEEVGSYGAKAAVYGIDCDYAIAIDVGGAYDAPDGNNDNYVQNLDGGPGIALRLSGYIAERRVRQEMVDVAVREGIAYQDEMSFGGTDVDQFAYARTGIPSVSVGVPMRYIHTSQEILSENDIEAATKLLCAFVLTAEKEA